MIKWIKRIFEKSVQRRDYESLVEEVVRLRCDFSQMQALVTKQSELIAALANIQHDIVSTVAGYESFFFSEELEDTSRVSPIVFPFSPFSDDDDLLN